ncbi:MAG: aquaporin [Oscillospiraceae bacterium]|jgi:aquaporin Z|nr:aquaporin [Oscillospiraceae bacterium]
MNTESIRKYTAECLGTFVLVLFGCGGAYFSDGYYEVGLVGVALAFGLALACMAYTLGPVSGCHVNPAVSLAMLLRGRLSPTDFACYLAAQVAGAFAAVYAFGALVGDTFDASGAVNSTEPLPSAVAGLASEAVLTFVFVLVVLTVTAKKEYTPTAALAVGLALTLVHILGINMTGTSVNPARSLAPAVATGQLQDLWVFIAGPFAGGALAAAASLWFYPKEKAAKKK